MFSKTLSKVVLENFRTSNYFRFTRRQIQPVSILVCRPCSISRSSSERNLSKSVQAIKRTNYSAPSLTKQVNKNQGSL